MLRTLHHGSVLGRIIGLFVVLVLGGFAQEVRSVRVGVLVDNYPFSFRDKSGKVDGFAYALTTEIGQVMGLRLERIEGATKEINGAFGEGKIDMLQSYAQFPEREASAEFSVPYLIMKGAIFVRRNEHRIKQLSDLKGRKVLVHAGSLGELILQKAGLADSIIHVESVEDALTRLNQGEGDATLIGRLSGLALGYHLGLRDIRVVDAPVDGYTVRYCLAVRKGEREALAQINEGLAILVRTGRFNQIYQKWFGRIEPVGYTKEQVAIVVALGLALALAVAIWAWVKQRALRKRIAQQAEALRVSEERHRVIFEGAHEGLLVLSGDPENLVIEQINPVALRLLAPTFDSPVGTRLGTQLTTDAPLAARVQLAAAAGKIEEFEHERPDGSWLRVAVGPLGRRRLVALTHITEQVQARTRLHQQEEQIRQKQKLEAVGTLAGGVAHDFNNLLTAIMGNTELCLMNLPEEHPEADGMKQVLVAARRARDLVRQILSFSRHAAPGREVVMVGLMVKETINLLQTLARSAVEFEIQLPPDLPPMMADPGQVHQVLMNIGTNAVQAMRGTAGRLIFRAEPIEVRTDRPEQYPSGLAPGNYVRISVQDNGPGMTPEVQLRVFEPFYTTKAPGEGTGLGLSVVHGIMQQHGGAVTLYSQVGRGTLFNLYFPSGVELSGGAEKQKNDAIPTGRGEHILFIDDETSIVTMAQKMLGQLGYRVTAFTGADEALTVFAMGPDDYAVVISDLTMPRTNGLQFLERVRALRARTPFVLTSGFFSEAERSEAVALGVTELLPKPLGYADVARSVAAALGRN